MALKACHSLSPQLNSSPATFLHIRSNAITSKHILLVSLPLNLRNAMTTEYILHVFMPLNYLLVPWDVLYTWSHAELAIQNSALLLVWKSVLSFLVFSQDSMHITILIMNENYLFTSLHLSPYSRPWTLCSVYFRLLKSKSSI